MNPKMETGFDLSRIRRLSQRLSLSCLVLIVVLPVLVAAYWLNADAGSLAQLANMSVDAVKAPLSGWQRLAGGLITEVSVALLIVGLWQARKCFKLFSDGQIFTAETVCCLKRFSAWVSFSVAAAMIGNAIISVVITALNPPGTRQLTVGIDSAQVLSLLFAGVVWLMAAVMSQGQRLAEENASYV